MSCRREPCIWFKDRWVKRRQERCTHWLVKVHLRDFIEALKNGLQLQLLLTVLCHIVQHSAVLLNIARKKTMNVCLGFFLFGFWKNSRWQCSNKQTYVGMCREIADKIVFHTKIPIKVYDGSTQTTLRWWPFYCP